MANKNFADLRIKLGRKQIPDKYVKVLHQKPQDDAEDVKSIPSDLDEDQWAEIHNYDYELWQEEKKKAHEDFLRKRAVVK